MAVAFDAKMTSGNSADGLNQEAAAATSVTSASGMTVGGSGSLLVAVLFLQNAASSTPGSLACTWNGVSMTLRASVTHSTGTQRDTAAIFTLVSPATGAKSLSASWTGANDAYLSCVSFTGTDTTTGIATVDSVTGTTGTTVTVTSTTDGATVAVWGTDGAAPTVNFTKIFSEAPLNPGAAASYTLGGTSNGHTFTGAGGTNPAWAGVHVIAAAAGGSVFNPYYYRHLAGGGSM